MDWSGIVPISYCKYCLMIIWWVNLAKFVKCNLLINCSLGHGIVKCNGRSKKVFDDKQFWTFLLLGVGCPQKLHNMPSCHLLARFTFPSCFRENYCRWNWMFSHNFFFFRMLWEWQLKIGRTRSWSSQRISSLKGRGTSGTNLWRWDG